MNGEAIDNHLSHECSGVECNDVLQGLPTSVDVALHRFKHVAIPSRGFVTSVHGVGMAKLTLQQSLFKRQAIDEFRLECCA